MYFCCGVLAVPAREGHHLCPHTTAVVTAVLEVGGDVRRLPGVTRIVEQVEQAGQVVNFCDYAAAFDSAVACIYTRRSRLLTDTTRLSQRYSWPARECLAHHKTVKLSL